jgi:hypothetical protein
MNRRCMLRGTDHRSSAAWPQLCRHVLHHGLVFPLQVSFAKNFEVQYFPTYKVSTVTFDAVQVVHACSLDGAVNVHTEPHCHANACRRS